MGWRIGKHDFPVWLWIFYVIPSKIIFSKLTPHNSPQSQSWQKFVCRSGHLMHFPSKYVFSEIATNPLTHGGLGFLNLSSMHFWTFNAVF